MIKLSGFRCNIHVKKHCVSLSKKRLIDFDPEIKFTSIRGEFILLRQSLGIQYQTMSTRSEKGKKERVKSRAVFGGYGT